MGVSWKIEVYSLFFFFFAKFVGHTFGFVDYARRVGFVVCIMQRRRSRIDGRTLARQLRCNKKGSSLNTKGALGPEKKPRPSAREGCK